MSDNKRQDEEKSRQEVKLEDLPVNEFTTEQVKGGPGKADLVNSIAD